MMVKESLSVSVWECVSESLQAHTVTGRSLIKYAGYAAWGTFHGTRTMNFSWIGSLLKVAKGTFQGTFQGTPRTMRDYFFF
jgi:hypothetical protein